MLSVFVLLWAGVSGWFVRTRFAGFALCCYCFLCEQLWLGDAGAFGFALPWRVLGEWTPSRQRLAL
jgi:hypothetical protein